MSKYEIKIAAENCTGCLRCQLACSHQYTRRFNPAAARVRVALSGADCALSFDTDCTCCGICADNCFYGALVKTAGEKS